jgi:hypothetical protein
MLLSMSVVVLAFYPDLVDILLQPLVLSHQLPVVLEDVFLLQFQGSDVLAGLSLLVY